MKMKFNIETEPMPTCAGWAGRSQILTASRAIAPNSAAVADKQKEDLI